jgi:hypothetical protein
MDPNNIPWKRLSAEGLAIVVSILLAFWIDAWWDTRKDRVGIQLATQFLSDNGSVSWELTRPQPPAWPTAQCHALLANPGRRPHQS